MDDDVDLADQHGPAIVRASKGVLIMFERTMFFLGLAEEENMTYKHCRYVVVDLEDGESGVDEEEECWYVRDSQGKVDRVEVSLSKEENRIIDKEVP